LQQTDSYLEESGNKFPVSDRLVNFLSKVSHKNFETDKAASFRWDNSIRLETDKGFVSHQIDDFLKRYGFKNLDAFKDFLKNKKKIVEVGAGEGRLVDWYLEYSTAIIYALEISDSVYYLKEKYKDNNRVIVLKADALYPPFLSESIDLVSADQCIHHTDYPGEIFNALASKLDKAHGSFLLSVYAEKSIVREQLDTIIRDSISKLPHEKIKEIAGSFTEIGRLLSETKVEVEVPKEFTMFGALAGEKMSLQRFVYYALFKCFYNPDFTLEKSQEFSHDWYCYPICNKVSVEEATDWFIRNGLSINYIDANMSNVNIRGSYHP